MTAADESEYSGLSMPRTALWMLWVTVALPFAVHAHHSFSGIYDGSRSITLQAVVREFKFIHPHPLLVIEVRVKDGATQTWRAEMDNRNELAEIGITKFTFQPGDLVVVSGSPGRTQPQIMYLRKLERPADGLFYEQVGSTPQLSITPRP